MKTKRKMDSAVRWGLASLSLATLVALAPASWAQPRPEQGEERRSVSDDDEDLAWLEDLDAEGWAFLGDPMGEDAVAWLEGEADGDRRIVIRRHRVGRQGEPGGRMDSHRMTRHGAARHHARMHGLGARLRDLNLSEQQRTRVREIHEGAARKSIQIRADLELARLDLHKLLRSDKLDRRALDAQIDRMATLRAGLQKEHFGAMLEVRSLLTEEQRRKLHEPRREGPRPTMRRTPGAR